MNGKNYCCLREGMFTTLVYLSTAWFCQVAFNDYVLDNQEIFFPNTYKKLHVKCTICIDLYPLQSIINITQMKSLISCEILRFKLGGC